MPSAPRLSPASRFSELVDGWLFQLGATKPAANTLAAYRRDLEGVGRRIAVERMGLGSDAEALAPLVSGPDEYARLVAALVRVELDGDHDAVLDQARGDPSC